LARGNLRSYSDIALCSGGKALDTRALDRWIEVDWSTGVVKVEAGLTLEALCQRAVRHGWFPNVVPGTGLATIGGAVASDVHGKNHALAGSFGCHVLSLRVDRSDRPAAATVTPRDGLFSATIGGLGLTGVITEVELQLGPVGFGAMEVVRQGFAGLRGYMDLDQTASAEGWEHRVAWLDLTRLGQVRGEYCTARWAPSIALPPAPLSRRVPFSTPVGLVNRVSSRVASSVLGRAGRGRRTIEHYRRCLHPLDAVGGWNTLWGPTGFRQYQCVVGPDRGDAIERAENRAKRTNGEH